MRSLTRSEQAKLTSDLQDKVGAYGEGVKTVSASFGRQIARSAVIAIIFSLFLVVLYIAVRFDLKFAIPVILAMVHDVVVCVGVYSLTGREVSTSTVAAVLTVLGYSIYGPIIIFRRIREDIGIMRRHSFATIEYPRTVSNAATVEDRKSTRLNSSHRCNSYAVFCLK